MKLKRLRQKGKAYYFDTQARPRKWIPLGSDRPAALKAYDRLMAQRVPTAGTVKAMLAEYVVGLQNKAPATLTQYRGWQRKLEAVFGDEPADSLTQADVLKYADLCPRGPTTKPSCADSES